MKIGWMWKIGLEKGCTLKSVGVDGFDDVMDDDT